jgi:NTE family protein
VPPAALMKLRGGGPGDCRDLKIYVGRIGFDQLGEERAARLGAIETRFKLPVETVDELIASGGEALAGHPTFRAFLKGQ